MSRNTVRNALRSDVIEPKFQVPGPAEEKLDPDAEKLSGWLRRGAGRPRKQGGRSSSYVEISSASATTDPTIVWRRLPGPGRRECHRLQQTAGRGSFVPLSFAPGEAFQFDWSEDFAVIRGVRVKLQVAHAKLCYSRAFTASAPICCRPGRMLVRRA